MSLDYNLRDVVDHKSDEVQKLLEVMVFATMFVDLGTITAQNHDEWLWRIEFCRQMGTEFGHNANGPWWPTRENLKRFEGLRTNVITKKRPAWIKERIAILSRNVNWQVRADREKANAPS